MMSAQEASFLANMAFSGPAVMAASFTLILALTVTMQLDWGARASSDAAYGVSPKALGNWHH